MYQAGKKKGILWKLLWLLLKRRKSWRRSFLKQAHIFSMEQQVEFVYRTIYWENAVCCSFQLETPGIQQNLRDLQAETTALKYDSNWELNYFTSRKIFRSSELILLTIKTLQTWACTHHIYFSACSGTQGENKELQLTWHKPSNQVHDSVYKANALWHG